MNQNFQVSVIEFLMNIVRQFKSPELIVVMMELFCLQ